MNQHGVLPHGTEQWSAAARSAAEDMVAKYGRPDEVTGYRLIWHWRLPWKRIEVVNPGFVHQWPSPHMDVVSQTVPYRVPPGRFSALTFYDGSVYAERTAGELTARCGGEKMNLVALNLAHDVITKRRTTEQARREYARLAKLVGAGTVPAYAAGLQFTPQYDHAGDPDVAVAGFDQSLDDKSAGVWFVVAGALLLLGGYLTR